MAAIFSLLAAASFGAGDFFGGLATRRGTGSPIPVVAIGHIAGLAFAVVLVAVFPGDVWSADLAIGAAAGVFGAVGLQVLYVFLALVAALGGRLGPQSDQPAPQPA